MFLVNNDLKLSVWFSLDWSPFNVGVIPAPFVVSVYCCSSETLNGSFLPFFWGGGVVFRPRTATLLKWRRGLQCGFSQLTLVIRMEGKVSSARSAPQRSTPCSASRPSRDKKDRYNPGRTRRRVRDVLRNHRTMRLKKAKNKQTNVCLSENGRVFSIIKRTDASSSDCP